MWNKTLNQVGVKASSTLMRVESIYFPPTIRASGFASSKANTASQVVELGKDSPAKVPLSSDSPSKEVEQPKVVEKVADTSKGVAPYATKPSTIL